MRYLDEATNPQHESHVREGGRHTRDDMPAEVLVDQSCAGELRGEAVSECLVETALVVIEPKSVGTVDPADVNENVHALPYGRVTAASQTRFSI
jgi:hypothetical protein